MLHVEPLSRFMANSLVGNLPAAGGRLFERARRDTTEFVIGRRGIIFR